jgi:hypothetical protein
MKFCVLFLSPSGMLRLLASLSLAVHFHGASTVFASDSNIALNRTAGRLEGEAKQLEGDVEGVEARDFIA